MSKHNKGHKPKGNNTVMVRRGDKYLHCRTPGHEDRSTHGSSQYCYQCFMDVRSEDGGVKAGADWHRQGSRDDLDRAIDAEYQSTALTSNLDWSRYDKGTKGTTGAKSQSVSLKPTCGLVHNGQTPVFTLSSGKILYAARGDKLHAGNVSHLGLIIDCADIIRTDRNFIQAASPKMREALSKTLGPSAWPEVLSLRWQDGKAPKVGITFWRRLLDQLPAKTCICCHGSHGRTGTALASLLVADGYDPSIAITLVRDMHCKRAIETPEQESYIRGLEGEQA